MNKTETIAYNWLTKQGYTNIAFHKNTTPDFTTNTKSFEVKRLIGNSIRFSAGQFEQLSQTKAVSILVFNHNSIPLASIPFTSIKTGKPSWKGINIIQQPSSKHITTMSLKKSTLSRFQSYANYGDSLESVLIRLMDSYDKYYQKRDAPSSHCNTQQTLY